MDSPRITASCCAIFSLHLSEPAEFLHVLTTFIAAIVSIAFSETQAGTI
jgi:hypothetical protein